MHIFIPLIVKMKNIKLQMKTMKESKHLKERRATSQKDKQYPLNQLRHATTTDNLTQISLSIF